MTENDALSDRQQLVERYEDFIFVFLVSTVHIELTDVVNRDLSLLEFDAVRIWREFGRKVAHLVGEGCGKEDNLNLLILR